MSYTFLSAFNDWDKNKTPQKPISLAYLAQAYTNKLKKYQNNNYNFYMLAAKYKLCKKNRLWLKLNIGITIYLEVLKLLSLV